MMTMKVSAEDIFEKEQTIDAAQLAKLDVYRNRLRIAFGMAITLVLLVPELVDIETPAAPLLLLGLIILGLGQGILLLFGRKWRNVSMAERRPVIVQSFVLSLVVFAFLPGMAMFTGDEEVFPAFVVLGLLAYGLHRLNKRWARSAESDEELFP
jgi:hypothetical protein